MRSGSAWERVGGTWRRATLVDIETLYIDYADEYMFYAVLKNGVRKTRRKYLGSLYAGTFFPSNLIKIQKERP